MTKLVMRRVGSALVPATKAAQVEMDGVKGGVSLMVAVAQPRNGKFHRLYWQFCTYVAQALNNGPGDIDWDQERVSDRLKIATGYCEIVRLPPTLAAHYGADFAVKPVSISFAKMDEAKFGRFVEDALQYILKEFGPWVEGHENWTHVREIVNHAGGVAA